MKRRGERGLTLVELIVAFTIMLILTSMAVPLARTKLRAERERDLRYALREMRQRHRQVPGQLLRGLFRSAQGWAPTVIPNRWTSWWKA